MAWLARLDARARRWPLPARWTYTTAKWCLIALGAFCAIGLALQRNALGLGIVVAAALAAIKGITMALTAPPAPPRPPQND